MMTGASLEVFGSSYKNEKEKKVSMKELASALGKEEWEEKSFNVQVLG